jgi:nucleoside 2-deoxyribosyltransferase
MSLSKSQRIRIIQDVSDHLGERDWTTIDLTLDQFGFQTTQYWSGTKKDYIIKMISNGSGEDLTGLGQHFGMKVGLIDNNLPPATETPYWSEGQLRVFISHISSERVLATEIQTALSHRGMSGFVAHKDIHPTLEWQNEVERALATCDLLVALIHPGFKDSAWCDQEVGYALGRGIPVFAVKYGADPHGFVSRFQAFSGNKKTPYQLAKEVFEAALNHKKLQEKMADIVISLFVNSGSFSAAKERIEYVERLTVWNPSFSARIADAMEKNTQVKGAWGVPDQVSKLLEKWKDT